MKKKDCTQIPEMSRTISSETVGLGGLEPRESSVGNYNLDESAVDMG